MDSQFSYFLKFGKIEKAADGSRIVSGYASTPTLDLDDEIVSLDAVKKALPAYMEWRNIRQMHQAMPVGTAKDAGVDGKGLFLTARIVEPTCIKLIDEEVLKGFSIGGKKLAKKGNTITEIDLIEISVVDRPSNPDCRFSIQKNARDAVIAFDPEELGVAGEPEASFWRKTVASLLTKAVSGPRDGFQAPAGAFDQPDFGDKAYEEISKRQFSTKEREDAAASGEAMPDGSFPIKNTADLKNAIQAHGRAKDPAKAKAHIVARAKALKATDQLPDGWDGKPSSKAAAPEIEAALKFLADNGGEVFGEERSPAPALVEDHKLETPASLLALLADGDLAKKADASLPAEINDRFSKGLHTLADLAYSFGMIRSCQRRLIAEGAIEKDGDDTALATRLGEIAKEIAEVISTKAQHEASEAIFMTDADDLQSFIICNSGELAMSSQTEDLAKRSARATAKENMGKAASHLRKSGKACADGMAEMKKLGQMHAGFVKAASEATKTGKTPPAFDHAKAMGHLQKAAGFVAESGDHQELANQALMRAASVWGTGDQNEDGKHITSPSQEEITEGAVPWYSADAPYSGMDLGGKVAKPGEGFISKRESELLIANAKLEGKVEALSKLPAGERKGSLYAVDKSLLAEGEGPQATALGKLMEGVSFDQHDSDSLANAAGVMIGNMIANPKTFGRAVIGDPKFRGMAGSKA